MTIKKFQELILRTIIDDLGSNEKVAGLVYVGILQLKILQILRLN